MNRYSITTTQQEYFSIRLAPSFRATLVPLLVGASLQALPAADTAVTALVVLRTGTFGLLVAAPATTRGTYTMTTARNPDPRVLCVSTDVTMGVSFNTAIMSSCRTRTIRIIPALAPAQELRVSVTSPGRSVTIELRNTATGALLDDATATPGRLTATITYRNGAQAQLVYLRVTGGSNVNDLVPLTISP